MEKGQKRESPLMEKESPLVESYFFTDKTDGLTLHVLPPKWSVLALGEAQTSHIVVISLQTDSVFLK